MIILQLHYPLNMLRFAIKIMFLTNFCIKNVEADTIRNNLKYK